MNRIYSLGSPVNIVLMLISAEESKFAFIWRPNTLSKKYVLKFCFSLKPSEVKMASLLIGKDAGQRIAFKSETFKFRPSVYFLFQ